jgi:hypothetical protein
METIKYTFLKERSDMETTYALRDRRVIPKPFTSVWDNHTINNLPIVRFKEIVPVSNIKR